MVADGAARPGSSALLPLPPRWTKGGGRLRNRSTSSKTFFKDAALRLRLFVIIGLRRTGLDDITSQRVGSAQRTGTEAFVQRQILQNSTAFPLYERVKIVRLKCVYSSYDYKNKSTS